MRKSRETSGFTGDLTDSTIAAVVIITARKRSLGQGNIFTPVCHSVHRGGHAWLLHNGCSRGACVVAPGGHVVARGGHVIIRGACVVLLGGLHGFIWGACWFYSGGACVVFSNANSGRILNGNKHRILIENFYEHSHTIISRTFWTFSRTFLGRVLNPFVPEKMIIIIMKFSKGLIRLEQYWKYHKQLCAKNTICGLGAFYQGSLPSKLFAIF